MWAGGKAVDYTSGYENNPGIKRVWTWQEGPLAGDIFTECKNLEHSCEFVNNSEAYGHYHDWNYNNESEHEPNNSGYTGAGTGETVLEINTEGTGKWNDLSEANKKAGGYVAEFGNQEKGGNFTGFYSSTANVTMALVPGAPTGVSASGGSSAGGQATIKWTAPASNGSTITSYTATSSPGNKTCTWTSGATECTINGLTNGTSYTFSVTATNAEGTGSSSGASSNVIVSGDPEAPTGVSANGASSAGGQAKVKWTAPNSEGSTITGYTATSNPGSKTCTWTSGATECTITGLSNELNYTFTVTATNANGTGGASAPSSNTLISGAPGAPTGLSVTGGAAQAKVHWTAPSGNGSAITSYTVTSSPGTKTCTWSSGATECTVTGLTNGTPYTFTVTATNSNGTGSPSSASSAVTPFEAPGAPTGVEANGGSIGGEAAEIKWTAPANTGGSAITEYTVTASPEGLTCTTSGATHCTIAGLTNGQSYTFTVTATTAHGTSSASSSSNSTRVVGAPSAPVEVSATGASGSGDQASVTWEAPASDGGAEILSYTVTPYIGATAQTPVTAGPTARSVTVTGLTNGVSYTFKVTATNIQGVGPASSASSATTISVTAAAPTEVAPSPGYGTLTFTFQPPPEPPESPVTGYQVSLDGGVTWQSVSTTAAAGGRLQATLSGLTEGATYSLLVRAQSNAGAGAPSTAVQVTLPLSVASVITPLGRTPVKRAHAVRVSHRVVYIHWSVPAGSVAGHSTVGRFTVRKNGRVYETLPASARHVTLSFVGMKCPSIVRVRISTRLTTGVTLALNRTFHTCTAAPVKSRR